MPVTVVLLAVVAAKLVASDSVDEVNATNYTGVCVAENRVSENYWERVGRIDRTGENLTFPVSAIASAEAIAKRNSNGKSRRISTLPSITYVIVSAVLVAICILL